MVKSSSCLMGITCLEKCDNWMRNYAQKIQIDLHYTCERNLKHLELSHYTLENWVGVILAKPEKNENPQKIIHEN